jgi:hypothetical protein
MKNVQCERFISTTVSRCNASNVAHRADLTGSCRHVVTGIECTLHRSVALLIGLFMVIAAVFHHKWKVEDACAKAGYSEVIATQDDTFYCVRWHWTKGELIKYEDLK